MIFHLPAERARLFCRQVLGQVGVDGDEAQVPPVTQLDGPYGCGFFALVLDPDRFGGRTYLAQSTAALAARARSTPPAAGGRGVRMPGDRALEQTRVRLASGIPWSRRGWLDLVERLVHCGLDVESWTGEANAAR